MELLIVINTFSIIYIILTIKYAYKKKDIMTDGAIHHLTSHMLILVFLIIAINLYVYKGFISPLVFVLLHLLQHVTKENIRLMRTNRWTPTVEDGTMNPLIEDLILKDRK